MEGTEGREELQAKFLRVGLRGHRGERLGKG